MDSHFIIKKSLIYGIISTGVAIIYIFLVFGVGDLLKSAFGNNESEALSIFALVVIAFVFDPLKKRIQNIVDKIFYRERYDYQKTLLNFSKILHLKMNVNQIMNSVVNTISTSMHIDKIAGVILDEKNQYKCFSKNIPDELCMYSEEPHGLLNFLNSKKQTINLNDFIDQKSYYTLSDEEIDKITRSGVQLIIPMIANDKVIGFINSGPKLSEKVYSEEDIELLNNVASQAAISVENARLLEQEKTLIEVQQEIKLASQIQAEWLPKSDPDILGFDIAWKTIPAKNVGGDYIDFINTDQDITAICIGDVSGKGLPAAMLMGYVQAILRSQSLTENDIKESIGTANKLVYENSSNDIFVTLFYSILDSKNKVLYYLNAGHNYPVLLSSYGDIKCLFEGGLPLGIENKTKYQTGQVDINKNDILIMYTDGISESFNQKYEQYGEERLMTVLKENHLKTSNTAT